jgi:tight adherence protein C
MGCGLDIPVWPLAADTDIADIFVSVGIFLAVATLIYAVFRQRSKPQLSPQREAAIATGHTDRRTLFESPVLGPVMWLLLAISHRLAFPRLKEWIRRTLVATGNLNYYTPEEYLGLSILTGLALGVVLSGLHWLVTAQISIVWVIVGLVAGIAMMLFGLYDKAARRLRQISKRIPYALDLIALAMGAGATFTEAVKTIIREQSDDPFNVELKTLLAEIDLGTTRKRALQNMGERVPLESLRTIVASVTQAEELGTPLGDVLHDQATLLRLQRTVRAENAAAVASVRILIPCLLLVMAVILTIFGPAIVRAVRHGLI